jgi:hypothetical protein
MDGAQLSALLFMDEHQVHLLLGAMPSLRIFLLELYHSAVKKSLSPRTSVDVFGQILLLRQAAACIGNFPLPHA